MDDKEIGWEIGVPILKNKVLMRQIVLLFVLTFLITSTLMSIIFLTQGDIKAIPIVVLILFVVCLALFVLVLIITIVIFKNRMDLRYTLNEKGVLYEMIDRRGKNINRIAIVLGLLSRNPTTAGSGLIAKSLEKSFIDFRNVVSIEPNDDDRIILLKNEWRTLIPVYCNNDNYQVVKEFILEHLRKRDLAKTSRQNPLPKYIVISILTIIMAIPLFTLPYPFEINLFAPIAILTFTLASIWIIRALSYITIAFTIYVFISVIARLFQKTESVFFTRTYFWYELISSNDILMLILLFISLTYFISISIYALKGKLPSMLERDLS
jgi:hypothetical protein